MQRTSLRHRNSESRRISPFECRSVPHCHVRVPVAPHGLAPIAMKDEERVFRWREWQMETEHARNETRFLYPESSQALVHREHRGAAYNTYARQTPSDPWDEQVRGTECTSLTNPQVGQVQPVHLGSTAWKHPRGNHFMRAPKQAALGHLRNHLCIVSIC